MAQAKARLSEVVRRAQKEGPQRIQVHGREAAVVVSAEEWAQRTQPKETLFAFLRRSPLYGSGIVLERDKSDFRDLDL